MAWGTDFGSQATAHLVSRGVLRLSMAPTSPRLPLGWFLITFFSLLRLESFGDCCGWESVRSHSLAPHLVWIQGHLSRLRTVCALYIIPFLGEQKMEVCWFKRASENCTPYLCCHHFPAPGWPVVPLSQALSQWTLTPAAFSSILKFVLGVRENSRQQPSDNGSVAPVRGTSVWLSTEPDAMSHHIQTSALPSTTSPLKKPQKLLTEMSSFSAPWTGRRSQET